MNSFHKNNQLKSEESVWNSSQLDGNILFLFLFQIKNNPLNPAHATEKSIKGNKIKAQKRGYRNQLEMCAFRFCFYFGEPSIFIRFARSTNGLLFLA